MNEYALSSGLFGFCAVLAGHALSENSRQITGGCYAQYCLSCKMVVGVMLAVVFTLVLIKMRISFFTLPFILAVWSMQGVKQLQKIRAGNAI